jgi:hypothetical protein
LIAFSFNFQEVPSYVAFSNGAQERRHSELVSQSRHALDGQVYMVYGAPAAATVPRHSRPESFNDIARQHIGRADRILRDLHFPAPAFWPMADSGVTVNVVWDTELTTNFRAQSHALRGFQGMTSFAIGEAFLDVLVHPHVQNEGGSAKHLSSGDYDTWIVPDARIQILSLTTLTNQGHVVRIGGPTSGIFVAGRRDIFIPLFKDDRSGYYVLPVRAPSFRAAGLKPDITLQRRPRSDDSVFNVATTDASGSFQMLHALRPLLRCQQRAASVASLASRWALRLMLKTPTRTRIAQHLPSARCSRMPLGKARSAST